MRRLLPWLILSLMLHATVASAQLDTKTTLLQDEGVAQGAVRILNCTGAGITCSRSGSTGTLNAAGGAGSANVVAATVDFGIAGADVASVVVTGQTWVTASAVIVCAPTMLATADRIDAAEDAVIEGLTVAVSTRVASTGFTVWASPIFGRAIGKFLIHCTGA